MPKRPGPLERSTRTGEEPKTDRHRPHMTKMNAEECLRNICFVSVQTRKEGGFVWSDPSKLKMDCG